MELSDVIITLVKISGVLFVVGSMLAMGLSLTVPTIAASLTNKRLIGMALLVNFIAVPIIAYGAQYLIDESHPGLRTGLIIVAAAAGAPFLPKLAEVAKGSLPLSVGLMVTLSVATIVYLPLALPLLLGDGVEVDSWKIARSLIVSMLVPLGIGLFVRGRWEDLAGDIQPIAGQISSVALAFLAVALLVVNFSEIVDSVGTGGLAAAVIVLTAAFVLGYLLSNVEDQRSVLALGTGQRNLSAAVIVAVQNFSDDPEVITMVMIVAVLGLMGLFAAAGEMGKRARTLSSGDEQDSGITQPAG